VVVKEALVFSHQDGYYMFFVYFNVDTNGIKYHNKISKQTSFESIIKISIFSGE